MRAYATWHVAHQLAQKSARGRATPATQKYARSLVAEAIKLVRWLHDQGLELRDLRQDLIDSWIAAGTTTRRRVRLFLRESANVTELEQANRRVAHALAADTGAVTNAAAILRPPGTWNFKTDPPAPVRLERLVRQRVAIADVLAALPGVSERTTPTAPEPRLSSLAGADPLRAIDPAVYVHALLGQSVGRTRKVSCPFHTDTTPSLHVYETPEGGWYCYGCRRGTSVYDLAGPLWSLETRRSNFVELRRRLSELLLPGLEAPVPPNRDGR